MSYIRRFRILISVVLWLPLWVLSIFTYASFNNEVDPGTAGGVILFSVFTFPLTYIISIVLVGFISSFSSNKSEIENTKKGAADQIFSIGRALIKYVLYFFGFIVLAYLLAYLVVWVMSGFTLNPFTSL